MDFSSEEEDHSLIASPKKFPRISNEENIFMYIEHQVTPTLKMKIKAVPPSPETTTTKTTSDQQKNKIRPKEETSPYFFNKRTTELLLDTYKKHSNKMNDCRYRKNQVWQIIGQKLSKVLKNDGSISFPTPTQCMNRYIKLSKNPLKQQRTTTENQVTTDGSIDRSTKKSRTEEKKISRKKKRCVIVVGEL